MEEKLPQGANAAAVMDNSPYYMFRALLEDYRQQQLSVEDFLDALDLIDQRLQFLSEGLSAPLQTPGVEGDYEDEPDEAEEVEVDPDRNDVVQECLQLFVDASDRLRMFAEKGAEEAAVEGLGLAREGHELWLELLEARGDDIERLEQQLEDLQDV